MESLFKFLASKNGRIARVVVGALLIVIGIVFPNETLGWGLVFIGFVPILAGALDKCLLAPLFGKAFDGKKLRDQLK